MVPNQQADEVLDHQSSGWHRRPRDNARSTAEALLQSPALCLLGLPRVGATATTLRLYGSSERIMILGKGSRTGGKESMPVTGCSGYPARKLTILGEVSTYGP